MDKPCLTLGRIQLSLVRFSAPSDWLGSQPEQVMLKPTRLMLILSAFNELGTYKASFFSLEQLQPFLSILIWRAA